MDNIVFQYIYWHYCEQAKAILIAWTNVLAFNFNYWSVPLLLGTLFSYWHKYQEPYSRGFDLNYCFNRWRYNSFSVAGFTGIFIFWLYLWFQNFILTLNRQIFTRRLG
jgi:hypothetical protein